MRELLAALIAEAAEGMFPNRSYSSDSETKFVGEAQPHVILLSHFLKIVTEICHLVMCEEISSLETIRVSENGMASEEIFFAAQVSRILSAAKSLVHE